MAPTVLDLLNMQDNLEHHNRALGGWSWAFSPYWVEDVSKYLYHPRVADLARIADPIEYNERLTMPKLLIAAVGDEFFPPDGTHYFWDTLTPPKYFRTYENDAHSLSSHWDQRDQNIQAFFLATYRGLTLPQVTYFRSENATHGITTLQTSPSVLTIGGWYGDTTNETCEEKRNDTCRRDFRIQALRGETGIMWYPVEVTLIGIDRYQLVMKKREDFGYRGFFIEMSFQGPDSYTHHFTTDVNIIPDTFPYPKCASEEECRGRLV
jgi:PhoPQ-activated pathogenicity-related protein